MPTIIELIKQDHRDVESLFEEFQKTQDYMVARKVCAELTAHALLEEELLYPLLRQDVNKDEAEHAQEEHDEAKQLIARIEAIAPNDPELVPMMQKLEKGISHHVEEEESEVLPDMERKVADRLTDMEEIFVQRKEQLVQTLVDDALEMYAPDGELSDEE